MSGTSFRTVSEVTLILFEESVELFISRSIPTGNIVHLFATDASVSATDTNNAQTWKLSKVYNKATTHPDTIYVRVTCSNGTIPTPPFFTVAYTYFVNVVDARFNIPTRELVLLTNSYNTLNPRTMEYTYDFPENIGVVSVVPSTPSEPNPISSFIAEGTTESTGSPTYGNPVVTVEPAASAGNYRLRIVQNYTEPGTNTIDVTILFNRYNAYRTYTFTYNILQIGDLRYQGYAAAPFLIDALSYDNLNLTNIAARYIHNSVLNSGGATVVLNGNTTIHEALGNDTSILPSTTYYNVEVSDFVNSLVTSMNNFPLVQCRRQNDFVLFELDNRSTIADYHFAIQRSITFDSGEIVRCEPLINRLLGFTSEELTSSENTITSLQTIQANQIFLRVVPPVISLELEAVVNQQEGIVRQSESVRLFNFLMNDSNTGYKRFENTREFPERILPFNSNKIRILRFKFLYNRMGEVQNIDTNGIPVEFLEPYYITLRFQFRIPNVGSNSSNTNSYDIIDSYITLTGTEAVKEIILDQPIVGIQLVEMTDARLPKQAEAVATSSGRRSILGVVVDRSLI
jgi:hypothetical protein